MKQFILYIGISLLAHACQPQQFTPRTGDLLFQVNEPSAMTNAITDATAQEERYKISHVAIYRQNGDRQWVLEASSRGGVRRIAWREFLASSASIGGQPGVIVMRVDAEFPVEEAIRRAESHIGEPYDYFYLPDNGKMYCSELVCESYRFADGSPIFTTRPMNFRNAAGELPAFWVELFDRLGEPVPEGVPGTNPAEMAKDPVLKEVHRFF